MAVNISAPSLSDPGLVELVRKSASAARLPLDALEIEVTETGWMADAESARRVLCALCELGVGIALDDFGTGYSSLLHVRQYPVTTIKIDMAFVRNLVVEPNDLAIVTSVIDLARSLGLHTVAEGIETPAQLSLLHRLGCAAGQGYLWSRALPRDELAALLRSQTAGFLAATSSGASQPVGARERSRIADEHRVDRIASMPLEGPSATTIAAALNAGGCLNPAGLHRRAPSVARAVKGVERRPGVKLPPPRAATP